MKIPFTQEETPVKWACCKAAFFPMCEKMFYRRFARRRNAKNIYDSNSILLLQSNHAGRTKKHRSSL